MADAALDAGRITVDDVTMNLGARAPTDARIKLDGRVLKAAPTAPRVWLAYKHKGEQVAKAERDEKIPSVFSRVRHQPHVLAVGSLGRAVGRFVGADVVRRGEGHGAALKRIKKDLRGHRTRPRQRRNSRRCAAA